MARRAESIECQGIDEARLARTCSSSRLSIFSGVASDTCGDGSLAGEACPIAFAANSHSSSNISVSRLTETCSIGSVPVSKRGWRVAINTIIHGTISTVKTRIMALVTSKIVLVIICSALALSRLQTSEFGVIAFCAIVLCGAVASSASHMT